MERKSMIGILGALALSLNGQAAFGFERGELGSTQRMAHELSVAARHVQRTANDQSAELHGDDRRMLTALERFAGSARRLNDTLETFFKSPGEVRQTLALLNEDSAVVERSIRHARPMREVLEDWDRCDRLLASINTRLHATAERREPARDADARYYDLDGVRYPRNGDLYFRDGRWISVVGAPVVVDDQQWYTVEGTRYQRRGDTYYREGRWVPIDSSGRSAVKNVLRSFLNDQH
jgi:hypothetical protein